MVKTLTGGVAALLKTNHVTVVAGQARAESARTGLFTQEDIDQMDAEAAETIEHAVEFAKASPMPSPEGIEDSVYAQ